METLQSNRNGSKPIMTQGKLACFEGILIAILSLLPPKSIFRFMCVSKEWKRILAEPFFIQSYYKAVRARNDQEVVGYGGDRLLAFMSIFVSDSSDTLPLTRKYQDVKKLVPERFGRILSSYNGLILTCELVATDSIMAAFYIVNPLTRMWVSLPETKDRNMSSGFTWEENMHDLKLTYKVVVAYESEDDVEENKVLIDTFCSKSGKWEESILIGQENLEFMYWCSPLVSNGVFYWYSLTNGLVAYHSNRDEKHVQLIKFPCNRFEPSASVVDDVIWYGMSDNMKGVIKFWKLPKEEHFNSYEHATTVEKNKWILMHTISMQSFCKELDATIVRDAVSNRSLNLLALLPCYPVLVVLSNDENIILYNLKSKRVELVPHLTCSAVVPVVSYLSCPYVESLSLSCHALSTDYY